MNHTMSTYDILDRAWAALVTAIIVAWVLATSGCASTETVTTTTAPDGTVTQTVQRPIVDPFDAALAGAAAQLMTLQGGFAP